MHNVEYYTYEEKVNKKKVQEELDNYVSHQTWQEGGNGTDGIRWEDSVICDDYESAEKWIQVHDKGWYDCLAVRYYEDAEIVRNNRLATLEKNAVEALKEYNLRYAVIYPSTLKSELITCKNCGSKLARKFLHINNCPVCLTDLRPEYIKKSIQAAKDKHLRELGKLNEYKHKHSKKQIKWLVKIEYHT